MHIYVLEGFRAGLELVPGEEQGGIWALGQQQKRLLRAAKTFSTSLCWEKKKINPCSPNGFSLCFITAFLLEIFSILPEVNKEITRLS